MKRFALALVMLFLAGDAFGQCKLFGRIRDRRANGGMQAGSCGAQASYGCGAQGYAPQQYGSYYPQQYRTVCDPVTGQCYPATTAAASTAIPQAPPAPPGYVEDMAAFRATLAAIEARLARLEAAR